MKIQKECDVYDSFEGCIIGGAIGDAWGSAYENIVDVDYSKTFFFKGQPQAQHNREWQISDDTLLTLATCEALAENNYTPETLSNYFLKYYRQNKLRGIGASTLKAITDLQSGIHWTQSGRSSEYAAGNGAAMRIAPFAFFSFITKENIYDAARITHRNDEAYVGALAVYLSIKAALKGKWNGDDNLLEIIIPQLPDTNVKDRLIEINTNIKSKSISKVAELGNSGYVVDSVPFAIYAASLTAKIGITNMLEEIVQSGGDTDTNASIAGQITGALIGANSIPSPLAEKLKDIPEYSWMKEIIDNTKRVLK